VSVTTGEIRGLYVHPEHWGIGIGGALLRIAEGQLGADGYGEVTLWVLEENVRGRRFYEAAGYHDDASGKRVTARGGRQMGELRMRKLLAPIPRTSAIE
jgi:ribosomal protein S18 acetylase RimI-like enzyme